MSLKHVSGWLNVTGGNWGGWSPADPDYDHPVGPGWNPVDPGWGTRPPIDPGYGRPDWGGGRPDNELPGGGGHVWGALIRWLMRPQIDNDPSKPPGRPVIDPPPPGHKPPVGPPGGIGHWEPIDPGYGKPPLWGFIQIDNGLPVPPGPPPHIDNTLPGQGGRPDNSLPGQGGRPDNTLPGQGHGGAWVPVDPDFGKPVRPCLPGGKPHPPIWAWIPDRPVLPGGGGGSGSGITFYPADNVTVLASGGSGSINVNGGAWEVDAASVPAWVTITPMSGAESVNMTYNAAQNTTGLPRQAFIMVSGAKFTINQGAV